MFGRRCMLLSALVALLLVGAHAADISISAKRSIGGRKLNQFGGLGAQRLVPNFLHQSNTGSNTGSTGTQGSTVQPISAGLPLFPRPNIPSGNNNGNSGQGSSMPSGPQQSSQQPTISGIPFFHLPTTGSPSNQGSSTGVQPISGGLPFARPPFTGTTGTPTPTGTTGTQGSSGTGVQPISTGLPFARPPFTGTTGTPALSAGVQPISTGLPLIRQPSAGTIGTTGATSLFAQRLQGFVKPVTAAAGRFQRRDIPLTSAISQSLARSIATGSATAAASAMATAISSNPQQAAQGWLAAAASAASSATGFGGRQGTAVAEAFAQAVVFNPARAGIMYAHSAALAVSSGQTEAFATAVAQSFSVVRRRGHMPQFAQAVATAIATSGDQGRFAYGMAIARAVAAGGDGQAAVAEATATVFCTGGSTATAWASAYAVSLTINPQGCLVLNQARAIAVARCNGGVFTAQSFASATSTVLGFCGLSNGGSAFPSGGGYQLFGNDVPSIDPSVFGGQGTDFSSSGDDLGFGN